MKYEGVLTKMQTENGSPIQYYLVFESDFLHMNQVLGKNMSINFLGYQCLHCKMKKKIYRQGYCYNCFYETPQTADWIIRPELSTAHLDKEDRDLEFEKRVQLQPHIVYLANSSNVKVGVTRKSQVPTRWIDQGAHEAIEVVEVPNRYLAGITEMALKEHVSDKTNWRSMLTNTIEDVDLVAWKHKLRPFLPEEAAPYFIESGGEIHMNFPVLKYPLKPKSLQLAKIPFYEGKLTGIKGQYLMFEDDAIFNIRSNEGLVVAITIH